MQLATATVCFLHSHGRKWLARWPHHEGDLRMHRFLHQTFDCTFGFNGGTSDFSNATEQASN